MSKDEPLRHGAPFWFSLAAVVYLVFVIRGCMVHSAHP